MGAETRSMKPRTYDEGKIAMITINYLPLVRYWSSPA